MPKQKINELENMELVLKCALHKLDYQVRTYESLDSKSGVFLGFLGVIMVGIIALIYEEDIIIGLNFLTLAILGLITTFFLLIMSLRTQRFIDPPKFDNLHSLAILNGNNLDSKNKIIADIKKAYEDNFSIHNRKADFYDSSLWTFFASIILIFISLFQ
jgi:hypothetical protein